MKQTKKILFCIDSLKPGGAEIVMCNVINGLANDLSLDITVQLLRQECSLHLDNKVKVCKFMKYSRFYRKLIKWVPARLLHDFIIKEKYDYEIACMEGASTKVISGCNNKDTVKYAWVHTDMEKYQWSQNSYRSLAEEKKAYSRIDKVFAVSSDVKTVFSDRFSKSVEFVQNIIDDRKIEERAKEQTQVYGNSVFHIVSVGTVKPIKGYSRLIGIHLALKAEGINCIHYILGDGPDLKKLKNEILEANLQDRIILKGYIENPYPWIKEADLLACVSYAEGYSSVVCEAVILGTPVLTTDCSGMRDILADSKYGLIVENEDEKISIGLKKMIMDRDYYEEYSKRVRERRDNFNYSYAMAELRTKLSF